MAYRIIDDETALTIFEAIQENTTRSFGRYNCQRQLPKHKINGELIFYLDELLEFASNELSQSPEETLGQVVDLGLTAWFAGLAPEFQRKLGFSLKAAESLAIANGADDAASPSSEASSDESAPTDLVEALKLIQKKNQTMEELATENQRLRQNVEDLAAEKVALKRDLLHLEQVNEELAENSPQTQAHQAGYLADASQSGYMALTTHSLTVPSNASKDTNTNASSKKNKRKRKRKGGSSVSQNNGRPH